MNLSELYKLDNIGQEVSEGVWVTMPELISIIHSNEKVPRSDNRDISEIMQNIIEELGLNTYLLTGANDWYRDVYTYEQLILEEGRKNER